MPTRDFKETVEARAARDPAFAKALLDEAATLFLNGEPHTARLVLRDLVNASVGSEELAAETKRSSMAATNAMERQSADNVWDALENTPAAAANMTMRSRLLIAIEQQVRGWNVTQAEAA